MNVNTYWKVFVEGDESTFPCFSDKLIHVYTGVRHLFCVFRNGSFFDTTDNQLLIFKIPVYWQYVDKVPDGFNIVKSRKCVKPNQDCEFEDEGYCFDAPVNKKCRYCKMSNKYVPYNR